MKNKIHEERRRGERERYEKRRNRDLRTLPFYYPKAIVNNQQKPTSHVLQNKVIYKSMD